MRRFLIPLFILCLWSGIGRSAMLGDFLLPDSLQPELQAASAHNNRAAFAVTPSSGDRFVVYIPEDVTAAGAAGGLRFIASALSDASGPPFVLNLGGRAWFGVERDARERVRFFDGYALRNGVAYNVAFSLKEGRSPDAAVKATLANIMILPGLAASPAMPEVAAAIDALGAGEWDAAQAALDRAERLDPQHWSVPALRGRLAEMDDDTAGAATLYRRAASLKPGDADTAARAAGAEALSGVSGGVDALNALAARAPEEATVWEELGRVHLAEGNLDAAKIYFEEAAAVNPADEAALYNLAFITAQEGDYENSLRRSREYLHYYPGVPAGVLPDVGAAAGIDGTRLAAVLGEPLPLGRLGQYGFQAGVSPSPEEIRESINIIQVPTTVIEYEQPILYAPQYIYSWGWSSPWHRPWWKPSPGHRPRPPGMRPPHRPEGPGWGGSRPPRPPGGGGSRPPRPPEGGGSRPPRPPEGGGSRPPRPPSDIGVQPLPPPTNVGIRPLPAPVSPPKGSLTRPTRPAQVRPPVPERPAQARPPAATRPAVRPAPPQVSPRPAAPQRDRVRPAQPQRTPRPAGKMPPSAQSEEPPARRMRR